MAKIVLVSSFTAGNMLMGFGAMLSAAAGGIQMAALFLVGCIAFDSIDGSLARLLGASSTFGAELDSLADMSSFSLASAAVLYFWLGPRTEPWMILLATCFHIVAGAVRLARFNVSPYHAESFVGMPTTAVAAIIAATVISVPKLDAAVGLVMIGVLATLMVSTLPYIKLTQLMRIPKWVWLVIVALCIANLELSLSPVVVWLAIGIYICSGPVLWFWQQHARGLSATHVD